MAVRNEIEIGQDSRYNNMTMFRKVDNVPFNPQYSFDENDNISSGSNITVNYVEYYKNNDGQIIPELTKHKYYVVPNITEVSHYETVVDTPAVLDEQGNVITEEVTHQQKIIDRAEWMAATNWFLSLARTPIVAPYGIMDSIEATLAGLPMNVPNGYLLQQPL